MNLADSIDYIVLLLKKLEVDIIFLSPFGQLSYSWAWSLTSN